MKVFLLLIAIFALTFSIAEAQKPVFYVKWAKQISGQGEELPNHIAFDSKNNIYITGNYQTNLFFDNSSISSFGKKDYYMAKMDPDGNLFWIHGMGSSGNESQFYLTLNDSDEIIATGHYINTFRLDNHTQLTSMGLRDWFLARFDNSGTLKNYKTFTSKENTTAHSGVVFHKGDYFVSGDFGGTLNIDNKIFLNSTASSDPFMARFDKNFNPVWAKSVSAYGEARNLQKYINDNSFYITGFYYNSISFQGKNLNSTGGKSAYFAKYDINGNYHWATNYTGTGWQAITDVSADYKDNVYTTGLFENELVTAIGKFTSTSSQNGFFNKLDPQGNYLFAYPATSSGETSFNDVIPYDRYMLNCGGFQNDIEYNDYKLLKPKKNYSYLAGYDEDGNTLSSLSFYSSSKNKLTRLSRDKDKDVVIAGKFEGNICIGQEQFTADDVDTYIAKLGLCGDGSFQYLNYTTAEKRSKFNSEFNFVVDAHLSQNGIKLTDSDSWQHGAVWNKQPVKVEEGFETTFAFRFYDGDNKNSPDGSTPGADGLAFVLQTAGNIALGHTGGGIGYKGIINAFAIEIDTYANDDKNSVQLNDPNGNHLAVFANAGGILIPDHATNALVSENINIPEIKIDSTVYYCHIRYDYDEKKLRIYLDTVECYLEPVLVIENFNLSDYIDLQQGKAYAGITSATGDAQEAHELLEFSFCSKTAPTFLSAKAEEQDIEYTGVSNYPNPLYNSTNFRFSMKQPGKATIEIIDLLGNRIDFIDAGYLDKGSHSINWDASNIADGIYFYRITAGNEVTTAKMVKMK